MPDPCYKITDPKSGANKSSGVPFNVTFEAPCNDGGCVISCTVPGVPASVSVGLVVKTTDAPVACPNDCVYKVSVTITLPCPCAPQQATISLTCGGVLRDSVDITVSCP